MHTILAKDGNKLEVPTVHLNGTSKQELLLQLREAYRAVNKAKEALRATVPHLRDYYVQDSTDQVYERAREQHNSRHDMLNTVMEQLEAIASAVQDQGGK